jgi:hypothetical protein
MDGGVDLWPGGDKISNRLGLLKYIDSLQDSLMELVLTVRRCGEGE